MAIFAISYDLIAGKNYQKLWDELDRLGAHKALLSFYLANLTSDDVTIVRDHLRKFIDGDDQLMVVRVIGRPAFTKARAGTNEWISRNCP